MVSEHMATYVMAMYLINSTKTKDEMSKINYVCPGPTPGRKGEILSIYKPPKVAGLGSQGQYFKLSNLLLKVEKGWAYPQAAHAAKPAHDNIQDQQNVSTAC